MLQLKCSLILDRWKFTFDKSSDFDFHIFYWCELRCNSIGATFFVRRLRSVHFLNNKESNYKNEEVNNFIRKFNYYVNNNTNNANNTSKCIQLYSLVIIFKWGNIMMNPYYGGVWLLKK